MSRMQTYVHTVYPTLVVKKLGSEVKLQPPTTCLLAEKLLVQCLGFPTYKWR